MKLSHPENFNIELAEEVLGFIEINPALYRQGDPQACLIGWAGRLDASNKSLTGLDRIFSCLDGDKALGLSNREKRHIFYMPFPPWAKARLRNFIRQAQSCQAEQEARRQRRLELEHLKCRQRDKKQAKQAEIVPVNHWWRSKVSR